MSILTNISSILLVSEYELTRFISSAPHRYKKYPIPKRNGNGVREIAQPSKELKSIQKTVLAEVNFFQSLPIHESAKAYLKGVNIRDNAENHKENSYLLKMDFSSFFPSIKPIDLVLHIEKYNNIKLDQEDKNIISNLYFYKKYRNKPLALSIGAPSSPFISNTLLYDFDTLVSEFCYEKEITYSRYADDLTFSTNIKDLLFSLPIVIREITKGLEYPQLSINDDKTVFLSKRDNRHITGLVISNDGKVSIGRSKKRRIKSMVYNFSKDRLTKDETKYLRGYISFCKSVDKDFHAALYKKYGEDVLDAIKDFERP